jgi:hypothetical protein
MSAREGIVARRGVRARGFEAVAQVRGGAAGQLAGEGAVKV